MVEISEGGPRRLVAPLIIILISAIAIAFAISRSSTSPESPSNPAPEAASQAGPTAGPRSDLEKIIPASIGSRRLLQSLSGDSAMKATKELHKGSVKPAADAAIASYEGEITIWLTRYENSQVAQEQLERMKQAMGRYGGGFEQLSTERFGGSEVFATRPKGMVQYFWTRGDVVSYLIPGNLSQSEIESVVKDLNEKVAALPPLVVLNGKPGN